MCQIFSLLGAVTEFRYLLFLMYPVQYDHFLQFNININSFFTDDTCTQFLTIANIFLYYHKYIKKNSFNFFLQLIHKILEIHIFIQKQQFQLLIWKKNNLIRELCNTNVNYNKVLPWICKISREWYDHLEKSWLTRKYWAFACSPFKMHLQYQ